MDKEKLREKIMNNPEKFLEAIESLIRSVDTKGKRLNKPLTWVQSEQLLDILGSAAYPIRSGDVVDWKSIKHIVKKNTDTEKGSGFLGGKE